MKIMIFITKKKTLNVSYHVSEYKRNVRVQSSVLQNVRFIISITFSWKTKMRERGRSGSATAAVLVTQ